MVEWAHRFDCPVLLHEDDREWVMRPDPSIGFWSRRDARARRRADAARLGGHFAGGTVLHREGILLSGDIVQVIPDRAHVSFMYSYPNLIPLPEETIRRIVARARAVSRSRRSTARGGERVIPSGADGRSCSAPRSAM